MSEKAKSIEQRLKDDGLVNNDGSVGLKWETIPDPFCRDFPFELRHPGKVPCGYLDLMTMHSDKPPPPKTNAPPRRPARLQTSPPPSGSTRFQSKPPPLSKGAQRTDGKVDVKHRPPWK